MIRTYRKRKGWTMEHLAELMDVSRQQVFNWEHKRSRPPQPHTIRKLAQLLECDLKELILDFYYEGE